MKIAFVGQKHYFDCCVPARLPNHKIKFFDHSWGAESLTDIEKELHNFDAWIFFRGEHFPNELLKKIEGKKVWISTEPIERMEMIGYIKEGMKKDFDYKTHYDKSHLSKLESLGCKFDKDFQLPVDLDKYRPPEIIDYKYDVSFIGRSTPRRENYLSAPKHFHNLFHAAHGLLGLDCVRTMQRSRINLNLHIDNYLQLQNRVQNILACNSFVLSESLTHADDLKPMEHYVPITTPQDLEDKIRFYLRNESLREDIADKGYAYVKERFDAEKCWKELIDEVIK